MSLVFLEKDAHANPPAFESALGACEFGPYAYRRYGTSNAI